MFKLNKIAAFLCIACAASGAYAQNAAKRIVVTPQCLLKAVAQSHYKTLSQTKQQFALIEVDQAGIDALITAKTKNRQCGGFVDVTLDYTTTKLTSKMNTGLVAESFLQSYLAPQPSKKPADYKIRYEAKVNELLKQVEPQNMWNNLTILTKFEDRYANSDNGVKAAKWIKKTVLAMAQETGHADEVSVHFVNTGFYKQPSVVVKFGNSNEAGIVVGGHMDTLNSTWERKPGADDDGTGTVTVLEAARTIFASGLHFQKPIYFIWYAAEEEGLVGSGYVVNEFKQNNIPVDAVIQFDMTGYSHKNDPSIWLLSDYVNKDLTAYLETLVNTYVKQPVKYTRCGYACSDHASWNKKGFNAAMPFEAAFGSDNPDIHTSRDTMEKLSLPHMTNFTKLAVAFAVELAHPVE